jgi:hypothetical protein
VGAPILGYDLGVTKLLSPSALSRYHQDGFVFPIPVLSDDEAHECRRRLEALEAAHGGQLGELRQKPHLLLTWLADLVRHPTILNAVEDVLGPNLLVWSTSFFIKNAHDPVRLVASGCDVLGPQ